MTRNHSKWVRTHQPCQDCGSSDAVSYNDRGWGHCFACNKNFPPGGLDKSSKEVYCISKDIPKGTSKGSHDSSSSRAFNYFSTSSISTSKDNSSIMVATKEYVPLRGLSNDTLRYYGAYTLVDGDKPKAIVFPYSDNAVKHRSLSVKEFFWPNGNKGATLFGANKFPAGSAKAITITEGELDAMSVYQMMGSKYPAVSVQSSNSARRDCEAAYEYLNSFESIYLCFDNDGPGQKACTEVATLFDVNKVFHVKITGDGLKDANDYLQKGKSADFSRVWWNAKKFIPKGIINSYSDVAEVLRKGRVGAIAEYPFPTLQEMTYGIREGELVLFTAQEKVGKGLFIGTPLPTPKGWTTVANLKVGDELFTADGSVTKVTFITDQNNDLPCYRVAFADKSVLITDNVHRWSVRDLQNKLSVKTTEEMFNVGVLGKGSVARFRVPALSAVDLPHIDLPIDPYLFGVWLGDGHSYSANITVSFDMVEEMEQQYTTLHKVEESGCFSMRFAELTHKQLDDAGILKNKRIPLVFMRSSIEQRTALFKGITDTDGWGGKEFYSSHLPLFNDVVELARSLGYHVSCRSRQGKYRKKDGTVVICKTAHSFRYRKDRWKSIRSIEQIASVPTRCLTVDHPSHLFVAGLGWTVTHNTEIMRAIEYSLIKNTDYNIGIIHLEEEEKRSVQGLLSYELGHPVHLPDSTSSVDEQLAAYEALTRREGRVNYYTHFGSDDPDTILDAIRYLVGVLHCKFIFLDHITMLVTGYEGDDERKKLDYISTRLAMLTRELGFTLFLVSHVNDNGQTRGSRNISKVADLIVHMDRDTESPDFDKRNTTSLLVKGNRFAGKSGPAGYLSFDPATYQVKEKSLDAQTDGTPELNRF